MKWEAADRSAGGWLNDYLENEFSVNLRSVLGAAKVPFVLELYRIDPVSCLLHDRQHFQYRGKQCQQAIVALTPKHIADMLQGVQL